MLYVSVLDVTHDDRQLYLHELVSLLHGLVHLGELYSDQKVGAHHVTSCRISIGCNNIKADIEDITLSGKL